MDKVTIISILISMGVPTAITSFMFWRLKRHIEKQDKKAEEREANREKVMLLLIKKTNSTNVLAEATAKAVQRIPDAKCNGDMTEALARAKRINEEGDNFIAQLGIKQLVE